MRHSTGKTLHYPAPSASGDHALPNRPAGRKYFFATIFRWASPDFLARGARARHKGAVRIVIVEDHQIFREVLRKICAIDLGHEVVGEAGDGVTAVEVIARTRPDVVLLDLQLPALDGFGVMAATAGAAPEIKFLILSSHCDAFTVHRAEEMRVQGFVDKNTSSVGAVKEALAAIQQGAVWFSPAFREIKAAQHHDPAAFDKVLSDRECAVLARVGVPLADAEIAAELGISRETVEKHRANILRKLGLQTNLELVRYAQAKGLTLGARPPGKGSLIP